MKAWMTSNLSCLASPENNFSRVHKVVSCFLIALFNLKCVLVFDFITKTFDMKKILLGLVLALSIGCTNETPEEELAKLIEAYQNFQNDKDPDFPLGNYSETEFERRTSFSDSLLIQLIKIDPSGFGEDDKISYELLEFVLHEIVTKYKFKTHWNPILSDAGFHSSLTYQVRPLTRKKQL